MGLRYCIFECAEKFGDVLKGHNRIAFKCDPRQTRCANLVGTCLRGIVDGVVCTVEITGPWSFNCTTRNLDPVMNFPEEVNCDVAMQSTGTLIDLGPHLNYSNDPHVEAGIVFGGQDRDSGHPKNTYAAVWRDAGTGWQLLPELSADSVWSFPHGGSSDATILVGFSTPGADRLISHAVQWEYSGSWVISALPLPVGAVWAVARATSDDGALVVGEAGFSTLPRNVAVLWSRDGAGVWTVENLGTAGGARAYGVGLGTTGDTVFGNSLLPGNAVSHATRWTGNGDGGWDTASLAVLPVPDGTDPEDVFTEIVMARSGECVGNSQDAMEAGSPGKAVRWDAAGVIADLGAGPETEATDFSGDQVVGRDFDSGRAFAWSAATGKVDIHPAGWDFSEAWGIDAGGSIVGIGKLDGSFRQFLLVP